MPRTARKLAVVALVAGCAVVLVAGCGEDLVVSALGQGESVPVADAGTNAPRVPLVKPSADAGADGGVADAATEAGANVCPKTDVDSCYQCCKSLHPTGERLYDDAYYGCMCGISGACQQACASNECRAAGFIEAKPGSPCWNCEDQAAGPGGACFPRLGAACDPDVECTAFRVCWEACF